MNVAGILRAWGHHPTSQQIAQLERFTAWLVEEAIPAGGLGAGEAPRIEERHLLDSLAFLNGIPGDSPGSLLDLGSGVGLPGIPLAVMLPATRVTLLDRSGRRVRLARRAIRVLGLANVEVEEGPIAARDTEVVTMRAVMGPAAAASVIQGQFARSTALLALSRTPERPVVELGVSSPHTTSVIDAGKGMLDPPAWILIMAPS